MMAIAFAICKQNMPVELNAEQLKSQVCERAADDSQSVVYCQPNGKTATRRFIVDFLTIAFKPVIVGKDQHNIPNNCYLGVGGEGAETT